MQRAWRRLALFNIGQVDHVPLPAVAIHPLAFARIVDHILRQPLADDETNQRLLAIVDRFVRRTARRQTDKISRSDFMRFFADRFESVTG